MAFGSQYAFALLLSHLEFLSYSKVHTLRVKNGPELPPEGDKWRLSPGSYLNGTKEQNKEQKY